MSVNNHKVGGIRVIPNSNGSATGQIQFANIANTFSVSLQSPGALSGNYTVTLPGVDGSAGQALTTNGSGVWGWTSFAPAFGTQAANTVYAGPSSGSAATPTFRALVAADLPLATTSAFGAVKPDGSTITISAGVISAVGGGSSGGGVNVQTGNYTLVSGDNGKSVVHASTTPHTFTLPATPPSATWSATIQNIGVAGVAGQLTITSTPNINGQSGTNALAVSGKGAVGQSFYVTTDGTNYFVAQGGPLPGTSITGDAITHSVGSLYTLSLHDTFVGGTAGGFGALLVDSTNRLGTIAQINWAGTAGTFAGQALYIRSDLGDGLYIQGTGGSLGGVLATLIGGSNQACLVASTSGTSPCATFSNAATGVGAAGALNILNGYFTLSRATLAVITAWTSALAGAMAFATDAKNVQDDTVLPGSTAVTGGHGAPVTMYSDGTWRIP